MPADAKAPVVDPYAKLAALAAKSPVEVPDGPTPPGSAEWARWFGTEEVEGDNLKKHHEYQGHGGGYPPELAAYFFQCRVEGARWNDKTGTLDDQGDFGPTEALLDAIRGNKLAVLDLERRNMADDQLAKVWEALRGNTSVTELRAKYNNLAASGAALAAVLEGNKTITSADLSRNEMGEETMVAVAKMLEKNTGLTHLDVSTNMPGEDGLKAFAGALAANTTLRVLKLDCSQMKDADAPQFVEALKANTTLKEFTAFQNEVRDRELRKAVKHVVRP